MAEFVKKRIYVMDPLGNTMFSQTKYLKMEPRSCVLPKEQSSAALPDATGLG